ncbi:predicted protein [Plenodomus lingam JN3]|uniref:Predicted protein n=1 Tax=Leptosphaeria maculans (strain JN3 / isolate v23.1.3 / race Av1-4-5-6-7-8) TaxID=985895 RepID=E5AAS0_LEPMJ|nr:predicted protein [Plenodomus lingam JN3]CBY00761.1 predicted protein [Plenodomus lingam JN3]
MASPLYRYVYFKVYFKVQPLLFSLPYLHPLQSGQLRVVLEILQGAGWWARKR